MEYVENTNLSPADFDGRLKDLERRVHTLEDRHEDIVRTARADIESVRTVDGNPPPDMTVSDRERMAEERAATGRAHSDVRSRETQEADRAKGGDPWSPQTAKPADAPKPAPKK